MKKVLYLVDHSLDCYKGHWSSTLNIRCDDSEDLLHEHSLYYISCFFENDKSKIPKVLSCWIRVCTLATETEIHIHKFC